MWGSAKQVPGFEQDLDFDLDELLHTQDSSDTTLADKLFKKTGNSTLGR